MQVQGVFRAFIGVSCESKSLFLAVWRHKGWLAVPDKGLFSEFEECSSGGVFSTGQNLQVARWDA